MQRVLTTGVLATILCGVAWAEDKTNVQLAKPCKTSCTSECKLESHPATFEIVSLRRAFVRMEKNATVRFALINKQREVISGTKVSFLFDGKRQPDRPVHDLKPGEQCIIDLDIDTRLRPNTYRLEATVYIPGERPYSDTRELQITIVPRQLPHTMPVVMWGAALGQIDWLTEIGFTHCIATSVNNEKIWKAETSTDPTSAKGMKKAAAELDAALALGLGVVAGLSPGGWAYKQQELRRVGADGKHAGANVCGLFPQLPKFCYNVGESVSSTYGSHPAMQAAMIHTEVRGGSHPCYHDHDRKALKAATGLDDIPEGVKTQYGTRYWKISNFPANRVIPDNYPLYVYYKWFWKKGDGWNAMHTALHNGLKTGGRDHLWTFHDPAVRVPSVYGSGGDVDYLSHWTYSNPDPIRDGLCTDELFCMARGATRGDQKVMKMTQLFWYRKRTAPEPGEKPTVQTGSSFTDQDNPPSGTNPVDDSGRYRAAWECEMPHARFITIAPMHLRESLWCMISRPIQGIMFHGWGSLVPLDDEHKHAVYRYTNHQSKWELKRLIEKVVRPLGPTLMQIPDRKSDVAFLESFASQMLARRGTYGSSLGWEGETYHILQYAGLQPRVIYEETIQQEGLKDFKVLVMPSCDVLPQSVVAAVQKFQDAGGIIVADKNLCPAVKPDILMPVHVRPSEADRARSLNIAAAVKLREKLDPLYRRYTESSTPNVITRVRSYGSADYLFAVNDQREFGNYVGHHKLVMENGLPSDAELSIRRPHSHVYNLVSHREVKVRSGKDSITIPESFGPCEGRVFMITDRAIDQVRISAPETAFADDSVVVEVTIVGDNARPMDAVVPVKIDLLDPSGKAAEFSGYYGAKDGVAKLTATIAPNDIPGLWRIHVKELASGRTAEAYMRVSLGN